MRAPTTRLARLAETLWLERNLLEYLLFKLVEAKLILVADETRFVPQALSEVEQVVGRLREAEAVRSAAVEELGSAWQVDPKTITLGFLAERAPEPHRTLFAEHREGFMRLAREIEQVTQENRRLTSLAMRDLADTLDRLVGSGVGPVYTAGGQASVRRADVPVRLDEVL